MDVSPAHLAGLVGELPPGPAYRTLSSAIRLLVVDGRLLDGTRLPSERALAAALGLSRTTTTRAYDELRRRGLLESRQGSGSVLRLPLAAASASSLIVDPDDPDTISMTYSAPTAPAGLARAFEQAAESLPSLLATTGYLPDGLPALREALAQGYTDRGLPTDPEQIVVTNGALGAISLIGRALGSPSQRMIVEGCTYPHAVESLAGSGLRPMPLPIGEDPWDVEAARQLAPGADLAYLIPDFHNPTGAVMSEDTRAELARHLRRHDVVTVVDESLRRVNLDGVELPRSYLAHDPSSIVVDSFSKVLWGGLRVGWIRAPHRLVTQLVQARMAQDLGSAAFDQLVVHAMMTDHAHLFDEHLDRMRRQRDVLVDQLRRALPRFHVDAPAGGPSLWVGLPGRTSSRLVAAAEEQGLLLTPGPRFFVGSPTAGERHLRVPVTSPEHVLTEAVARLARAWESVDDVRRPADPRTIDLIA